MSREAIEVKLLLEAIYLAHGYDFRGYSQASLTRRIGASMRRNGVDDYADMQRRIIHDDAFFARVLDDLTVTTSEMFRDPSFFRALRERVLPLLRTYPTFNVWHAGCSTGEEVYSLAILLHEEGLLERATLYATDVNRSALKKAKDGIYSLDDMKTFTQNYQSAGGTRSFADYYTADYGAARIQKWLQGNMVFSEHNLVTDDVFCESHLALCRNVLIYFEKPLQNRVTDVLTRSLRYKGFLCLGSKETTRFLDCAPHFDDFVPEERIFQKRTASPAWARRITEEGP